MPPPVITVDVPDDPGEDLASFIHAEFGVWPRILTGPRSVVDTAISYVTLGGGIFLGALL
ncbi:MAG: hypothetical protein ACRDSL_13520 [Pseudonocardiaceae bacterium]